MDDAALSDVAKLALDCPVVTQAVALSRWIAESGPRPLTPRQVLRKPDIPVAAAVIGVAPPESPRTAADGPALNRPWNLALDTGLLRADGGMVTGGPALATWTSWRTVTRTSGTRMPGPGWTLSPIRRRPPGSS